MKTSTLSNLRGCSFLTIKQKTITSNHLSIHFDISIANLLVCVNEKMSTIK